MLFYIEISKIVANIKLHEIIVNSKQIKHKSVNISRNLSHRVTFRGRKKETIFKKSV
jgi:hypothetical protein